MFRVTLPYKGVSCDINQSVLDILIQVVICSISNKHLIVWGTTESSHRLNVTKNRFYF